MVKKQIIQVIQDLLLEHSYVTIPQLGGFVSKYQSAQIIPEKNIILPPSKKISFNAELREDDGLLINSLARQEGISIKNAEQKINSFVQKAFTSLDEGKKVVLDKIGSLQFNQHLNIEFEAIGTENYNPNSYGMVEVLCQALSNDEIVAKKNKELFTRRNLRRVAVVMPFIVVGTILSVYLNQLGLFSPQFYQQASVVPVVVDEESEPKDTNGDNIIAQEIDFKTNKKNALSYTEPVSQIVPEETEVIEETPSVIEEKEAPVVTEVTPEELEAEKEEKVEPVIEKKVSQKYQLIAGSFKSEANANRLSKKINKLDFQSEVVKQGNRYRVIASSYSKKSEAVKAKKQLKKQDVSTWVNTLK